MFSLRQENTCMIQILLKMSAEMVPLISTWAESSFLENSWVLFMVLRGNNYQIKPGGMIYYLPVTKGVKNQKALFCSSLSSTECQRACSNTQRSNFHSCTTLSRPHLSMTQTLVLVIMKISGQLKTFICRV